MAEEDNVVRHLLRELKALTNGAKEEVVVVPASEIAREKQIVREIADRLEEQYGENIPEDAIVEEAKKKDISENEARRAIDDLVSDGYLQRPHHMSGIVRLHGRTEFQRWGQEFPA